MITAAYLLSQAERERDITVEHLADIDRLVTESLEMLKRFDSLSARVLPLMEDYLVALKSREHMPASLLRMDMEHEKEMIEGYTNDIRRKIKGTHVRASVPSVHYSTWSACAESCSYPLYYNKKSD